MLLLSHTSYAAYLEHPKTAELHNVLIKTYKFTPEQLQSVDEALAVAEQVPSLIQADKNNKETTVPIWDDYKRIHVFPKQVEKGLALIKEYDEYFKKAERIYGVPAPIIAGILGVETKYGTYTGKNRVLDALATMGYEHPTRQPYFFSELAAYFAFCRDFGYQPTEVRGSYAGAMGFAQFMPSNYLRLAVDFDGDGTINLWSMPDAIGSIAHYFTAYIPRINSPLHWQRGQSVLAPVQVQNLASNAPEVNAKAPNATLGAWAEWGATTPARLNSTMRAGLLRLRRPDGDEYWFGLPNFYTVMSYNPRVYYAMAVTQLAAELQNAALAAAPVAP